MKMSQRWQGGNVAETAYKLENDVVNDDDEISNEIVNICV